MLVYLKKKKYLISSIFVIILDGIITYLVPSYFNKLNYLYPMLTVSLIPFLYRFNTKTYYQFIFILGIIYDLFYSNVIFLNAFIFLMLGIIDIKIIKFYKVNLIIYIILIILNIIIYDFILFILVYLTNYQSLTIFDYLYKIKNSIILNIAFGFILYFIKIKKDNI